MRFVILYHSERHVVISMWNLPRRMANQPPAPIPAIVSNTSHGRGFRSGTLLAFAMVSSNLSRIRRLDIACSPPPSIVKIFNGFSGIILMAAIFGSRFTRLLSQIIKRKGKVGIALRMICKYLPLQGGREGNISGRKAYSLSCSFRRAPHGRNRSNLTQGRLQGNPASDDRQGDNNPE